MLPDKIIEEQPLRKSADRYTVAVRIPWYRTLPLSSVTALEFTVDGAAALPNTLTWTVNGTTYAPEDLPARHDQWWNVLDSAELSGRFPAAAENRADTADVHVQVGLVIPYLTAGDGFLQIEEKDDKQLGVEEAS